MPHKQNPVICERICGLSRVLRGNMLVCFENINLWHERDISHSSAERVVIPDSTITIDYMLKKITEVIKNLSVNPKNMLRNMELNRGLVYSQKILIALMDKGLARMSAYDIVQDISLGVINKGSDFRSEVSSDERIKKYLTQREIEDIFNPLTYLNNVDAIYQRTGL
jgi:adenylosuccinate lyase